MTQLMITTSPRTVNQQQYLAETNFVAITAGIESK